MNERKRIEQELEKLASQWQQAHREWMRARECERYPGEERKRYLAVAQIEIQHRELNMRLSWMDEMKTA